MSSVLLETCWRS